MSKRHRRSAGRHQAFPAHTPIIAMGSAAMHDYFRDLIDDLRSGAVVTAYDPRTERGWAYTAEGYLQFVARGNFLVPGAAISGLRGWKTIGNVRQEPIGLVLDLETVPALYRTPPQPRAPRWWREKDRVRHAPTTPPELDHALWMSLNEAIERWPDVGYEEFRLTAQAGKIPAQKHSGRWWISRSAAEKLAALGARRQAHWNRHCSECNSPTHPRSRCMIYWNRLMAP